MGLDGRGNPAACSLSRVDSAERRERWLRLGDRALSDKAPTNAGVRLRFRRLPGVESELRELAALDRECCSFAAWSLRSEEADLILEISAEGDAAGTVRALFDQPAPFGGNATARG